MGASRQFVDSFGFSWQALEIVREVDRADAPPAPDGWLYFLSRGTTRRLRTYPRDWAAMSWIDLEDLCTRAEVVGTDAGARPVRAFSERARVSAVR
jgi:hypothetical protein